MSEKPLFQKASELPKSLYVRGRSGTLTSARQMQEEAGHLLGNPPPQPIPQRQGSDQLSWSFRSDTREGAWDCEAGLRQHSLLLVPPHPLPLSALKLLESWQEGVSGVKEGGRGDRKWTEVFSRDGWVTC